MAHDPIELNISIADIPRDCYWKTNDGKTMLTIKVHERREPSEKGSTHYATVFHKAATGDQPKNPYIAYGKFKPYQQATVNDSDLPPGSSGIEDAQVVNDDLPF